MATAQAVRSLAHLNRASEPDAVAVRVVARLRVAVAVTLAASGSFLTELDPRHETVFLVLGLVWVPAAAVVGKVIAVADDNTG